MTRTRDFLAPGVRLLCGLKRPRQTGFRVLILHDVPPDAADSLAAVLDDVEARHGILAPAEAERFLSGDRSVIPEGRTPVLVTFDDGFASNYSVALDILGPRNVKAIFFVCPGLIDAPPAEQSRFIDRYVFPDGEGRPRGHAPLMMTWDQVRELGRAGHTIGSHSELHRRLVTLPANEMEADLRRSRHRLEEELGSEVRWFAYPFGNIESVDAAVLYRIGTNYDYCCSGVRGLNTIETPPLTLFREALDLASTASYRRLVVDGGLDLLYWLQRRRLARMLQSTGDAVAGIRA